MKYFCFSWSFYLLLFFFTLGLYDSPIVGEKLLFFVFSFALQRVTSFPLLFPEASFLGLSGLLLSGLAFTYLESYEHLFNIHDQYEMKRGKLAS